MSQPIPRVRRTGGRQRALAYLLSAIALLLLVTVATVLWSDGVFTDEPRSDAERDYQLLVDGLKKEPKNPALLMTLAEAEYELGKEGDALEHGKAAVTYAKKQPGFRTRYANMLLRSDRVSEAKAQVEGELALKTSGDAEPYFLLAQIERETGDLKAAETNIRRAIEIVPTSVDFMAVYGTILEAQGEKLKAENVYKNALRYVPDYEPALAGLKRLGVKPPASAETTAHGGAVTP